MSVWRQAAVILLFAGVAAVASGFLHPLKPLWNFVENSADLRWSITLDEARTLMGTSEVVWIDARTGARYEEGHFPGAILLNSEEWGQQMFKNQDVLQSAFDRPVIVYCDGETCTRSDEIAERLRELIGLDPVYVLKGPWRDLIPEP